MFNSPSLLEQERKDNAKRERLRKAEIERSKRFFNAKTRLIGIDVEALEKQVNEKRERLQTEKRDYEESILLLIRENEAAMEFEKKIEIAKKKLEEEVNEFRKLYQKKEARREFDLNDPDSVKKTIPYRLFEDDSRLSVSSLQTFESEDPGGLRKIEQIKQQRACLLQQIVEHKRQEEDKKLADDLLRDQNKARERRADQIEQLQNECHKRIALATANFNKAMAEERKIREGIERQREVEDNQLEILNNISSDLLSENPEVSNSNLGAGRKISYMFKGLNEADKAEIRLQQKAQLEEMKVRREAERKWNEDWDDLTNQLNRIMCMKDQEVIREHKEKEKQIQELNIALGKEQRQHREYLDNVVYGNNKPTEAFYNQFNRSTR